MDSLPSKPLDLKLSYSGMTSFVACNYRYALQYREKLKPEFSAKSQYYLGVGSVVHKAMEILTRWHENGKLSGDRVNDVNIAIRDALATMPAEKAVPPQAIPDATKTLADWWEPDKLYGETVWFEQDLSETLSVVDGKERLWELTFHGIPDRIFLRNGASATPTYVVTDYKTGNSDYAPADPQRSLQLWLYAWLWRRHLFRQPKIPDNYRIAIRYELISQHRGVEMMLSPQQIESALIRATAIAQQIMVSEFTPSPGKQCYGCPFAQQCQFSIARVTGVQTQLTEA